MNYTNEQIIEFLDQAMIGLMNHAYKTGLSSALYLRTEDIGTTLVCAPSEKPNNPTETKG